LSSNRLLTLPAVKELRKQHVLIINRKLICNKPMKITKFRFNRIDKWTDKS